MANEILDALNGDESLRSGDEKSSGEQAVDQGPAENEPSFVPRTDNIESDLSQSKGKGPLIDIPSEPNFGHHEDKTVRWVDESSPLNMETTGVGYSNYIELKDTSSSSLQNSMNSKITSNPLFSSSKIPPTSPDFQVPNPPYSSYRYISHDEYEQIVDEVRSAIQMGIQPLRIAQGSSGSYFCRNKQGEIVGVFKPKNEEPYGNLNPKWTKWLHKTCLPCCFGRSCLIPNSGYTSEAMASVVDRHLGLLIVPRTEIVQLSSSSFVYSYLDRKKRDKLPLKIGSFQIFMHGYITASIFLREGPKMLSRGQLPMDDTTGGLELDMQKSFRDQFERMVVLDYLIRNTDRGLDNWMVKIPKKYRRGSLKAKSKEERYLADDSDKSKPTISIAAIDNGLAFPFKHPDQWRNYPFGWAYLPAALVPFSKETRARYLPKLTSSSWWSELIKELYEVASVDSDFDERMFRRQIALMKGQAYNLVRLFQATSDSHHEETDGRWADESSSPIGVHFEDDIEKKELLKSSGTPLDLVKMPPCLVWDNRDFRPLVNGEYGDIVGREGSLGKFIDDSGTEHSPNFKNLDGRVRIEIKHNATDEYDRSPASAKIPRHADDEPYSENIGEFLTSPIMESGGQQTRPHSRTETGQSSEIADTSRLMGSDRRHSRTSTSSSRRKNGPGESIKKIQHKMDAFRGKIVMFVKSQPWFSSW